MDFDFSAFDRKPTFQERLAVSYGWAIKLGIIVGCLFLLFAALYTLAFPGSSAWFLIVFSLIVFVLTYAGYYSAGETVRLRDFAQRNNMTYQTNVDYDERGGIIFGSGHSKVFRQLFVAEHRDFVELGNYEYTTGSGKNRQTHSHGFMRIKLPRRLPNMVLDSKKNNFFGGRFSNLSVGFGRDQHLSLEGDFDKYFTLYAPVQYKRDALYVFTPDVMQTLVTAAHAYDCEVIDDNLYIYGSTRFALGDRQLITELDSIARLLRKELHDQTDYYADERVGDRTLNQVAPAGARLKTGPGLVTKLVIAALVVYYLWILIGSRW